LDFDIGQLIDKYYIHPIVFSGEGYNPVNTITYAIILGISLFVILKVMDVLKIKLDERFVIATAPFILIGASLRVILDVGLPQPPFSYWFITPPVYVLAFAIAGTALLTGVALERRDPAGTSRPNLRTGLTGIAGIWAVLSFAILLIALVIYLTIPGYAGPNYWSDVAGVIGLLAGVMIAVAAVAALICLALERRGIAGDYSKPYFWTGVLGIIVVLGLLSTRQFSSAWWAPVAVVLLASAVTGAVYLIARLLRWDFLTNRLNVAILGAHMFDASSTFTAIDLVGGFAEKHVVPVFFINFTGSAAVMYLLKLAVFIPVIYLIEKYFKDDPQLYFAIKLVLLVLGFGPGIRNTLEMTFVQV
jgi:uncharacterized membrane protein